MRSSSGHTAARLSLLLLRPPPHPPKLSAMSSREPMWYCHEVCSGLHMLFMVDSHDRLQCGAEMRPLMVCPKLLVEWTAESSCSVRCQIHIVLVVEGHSWRKCAIYYSPRIPYTYIYSPSKVEDSNDDPRQFHQRAPEGPGGNEEAYDPLDFLSQ